VKPSKTKITSYNNGMEAKLMTKRLTTWTDEIKEHYLNPLHVLCRLRDAGINKSTAYTIVKWYEISIYYVIMTHV